LKQHPDIYLPEAKELHFFDRDEEYDKGIFWYRDAHLRNVYFISRLFPELDEKY